VYTLAENKDKAPMLLSVLENSTRTHEKYFGDFPFPKDKIAVVETPYLGMEHQTINGYGNNYQFVRTGEVYHDWLLHHELGHEWWGNKVSVGDWADFWLHEGLCTYGDWLFYLEHEGEEAYLKKVNDHIKLIKNEQPIVGPKNSTSDETYQLDIYYKGAYIIHSLRYILGDETLFPLLKAFLSDEKFTYNNLVETKDFTDFVQQYSGRNLEAFFQLYLNTADLPEVKVVKKRKGRYEVSFKNIDFSLPMDIHSSEGIQRVEISSDPVVIASKDPIQVDPHHWYLKKQ
jgi:aminopeptidase N